MKTTRKIGHVLKFIRIKAGHSLREFADMAEVSFGTVQKFEAGTTKLSPRYLSFVQSYADTTDLNILKILIAQRELEHYGLEPLKVASIEKLLLFIEVVDLHNKGLVQRQIAQKLKTTIGKVQYIVDKYNEMRGKQ